MGGKKGVIGWWERMPEGHTSASGLASVRRRRERTRTRTKLSLYMFRHEEALEWDRQVDV